MLIRGISNDRKLNLNFVTYLAFLSLIRPVANNCDQYFSLSIIYFAKGLQTAIATSWTVF